MEDVIFQGSAARRPVNVTEVSLFLDNTDSTLPIAYQEVVITRRLSRSGHSEYLLNNAPVRLRDIQDLLRGTGMGSDAGVVIEAKMIDLLLSDRAEERRSLFEEAAGIGLYRDRKHATERRLEETAGDLLRLEDLLNEVQSQIRSLARQKGKAERHAKLVEEKFSVQITLAQRLLDRLAEQAAGIETRHTELSSQLPAIRQDLTLRLVELEQRSVSARAPSSIAVEWPVSCRKRRSRSRGSMPRSRSLRSGSAVPRSGRYGPTKSGIITRSARSRPGSRRSRWSRAHRCGARLPAGAARAGRPHETEESTRQQLQAERELVRQLEQGPRDPGPDAALARGRAERAGGRAHLAA
jgi:chromosome segregation protein